MQSVECGACSLKTKVRSLGNRSVVVWTRVSLMASLLCNYFLLTNNDWTELEGDKQATAVDGFVDFVDRVELNGEVVSAMKQRRLRRGPCLLLR